MNFQDFKKDFPIFKNQPHLVYLDSTATSLKPRSVIEKLVEYYSSYSANIFRGVYKISEKATQEYEKTREVVAEFINARPEEVVFTRNTTESINLLAYALGRKIIEKGDEIVTTIMEHHSNFVPWQVLAQETGALLKIIDINQDGYLNIQNSKVKNQKVSLKNIITKKTKILTLTYVSNVLGVVNPIKEIVKEARKINPKIIVIVDAAQAAPHKKIDLFDLNVDFLAFSSHKMLGPTGVGVLWGRKKLLDEIFPFLYGGEMIEEVYLDKSFFKKPPHKFEAGTPSIGEVIAFKEAVKYLKNIGMENIASYEKKLVSYLLERLTLEFPEIKIVGPQDVNNRGGLVAFSFSKYHPHDVASILDEKNIAVRAGHHCAMPLHHRLNLEATVRVSFYLYNDENDIDQLISGLKEVKKILG